ncbi:putative Fe-Mo cluster-binding NifX family protein [Kineothrix alysoides]|uniref:Putative Fe-Mo cluster-binding NifX family protein n=1 Tax=Kineothrix alysoides TaxID=1469948 RepID=A0A4R1R3W4_9FIRM|nr:NifB/NifX family molybdenum-iron cluster-binding protein [Kineothrix alysoides]TCL60012.1 putative Fe-Mo cluster-binding NifX family protein [Kineothrix alysoides]
MAYRIAVTSSDGSHVDEHFGQAEDFWVYEVEEETGITSLVERRKIKRSYRNRMCKEEVSDCGGCCGRDDGYVSYVAEQLQDCIFLLTGHIGKKPYKTLERKGIASLETPYGLEEAVAKLNIYYRRCYRKNRKV